MGRQHSNITSFSTFIKYKIGSQIWGLDLTPSARDTILFFESICQEASVTKMVREKSPGHKRLLQIDWDWKMVSKLA